jgi:putative Mg2+ transporter-C (MgtC) family protein
MKIRKAAAMLAPLAQIPPPTTLDMLLRLGVTIALAGAVGWERRAARKPVGSRTMILTAVGAATFIMLGEIAAARAEAGSMNADPTRVLAYLVVGIGFLGGGAILHSRRHVRGMTTAATFWVTAAIGAAAGMGEFALAAILAGITLVTLETARERRPPVRTPPRPNAEAAPEAENRA